MQPGIKDRTFEQWVKNVGDQASKDGVNQTPTVLVDGKKLEPAPSTAWSRAEKAVADGSTSSPGGGCLGTNLGTNGRRGVSASDTPGRRETGRRSSA